MEVYEEAIDALLKQWDNRRNIERDQVYKSLALGRKKQLLNFLAENSFQKGEFLINKNSLTETIEAYMQSLPEIKEEIDGEVVLHAIAAQHGMFVERALKLYSFAHLSFQEYFVAKYIESNALKGSLKDLLFHVNHDQWREVFLLTTSLLDKRVADEFFKLFLKNIEELVEQNMDIQKLLFWANDKAKQTFETVNKYKENALRFWYIYRFLDLDSALARTLDSTLDLDLARTFNLTRTRASDLDLAHIRKLALDLDPNLSINLDLDLNLDLAHLHNVNNYIVNNYIKANQLLVDCLDLAFVSDKQSILDRLALPASS